MNRQEKINKLKELRRKSVELKREVDYYNALQLALKLVLNGSYGAFATPYFILFNEYVAGTITKEGRRLTKTMSDVNEDYWYDIWHEDYDLHKKMKIRNVSPIPRQVPTSVYGDSITGDSLIKTNIGEMSIEDLYNKCSDTTNRIDKEVVKCDLKSLNWTKERGIHYSKIKNVIKHKVSKKKWKLKVGGKILILTNDHSLIVFRNGEKIEVKPSDVRSDDLFLVNNNGNFEFEKLDNIECIGEFEDEYVYDLEMEDESHTFIANDILIHNTDSIFVGFKGAIDSCDWKDQLFNENILNKVNKSFYVLTNYEFSFNINNPNFKGFVEKDNIQDYFDSDILFINGHYLKDWNLNNKLKEYNGQIFYNWSNELEFIHGLDKFRIADYFKDRLDDHAASYGVENKQDFELERVSESIINIAKKKYIQHILYEDGIPYDRFEYIFPKGVELVRSSTPLFARDKIVGIVKYLFEHPDTFNIKELLKLVKNLRREFDLCVPDRIDEICMQSSCSKYEEKIIDDKNKLSFVTGAHFAVKASAYHNYLLNQNKECMTKYEFIKSGTKIKYYYCKDTSVNPVFAYMRGSYPIEFAPEIDLDTQFEKCILSPINSIIEPLNLPSITKRLSVVMDIFGNGFFK